MSDHSAFRFTVMAARAAPKPLLRLERHVGEWLRASTTRGLGAGRTRDLLVGVNAGVRLPCHDVCGSDIGRAYQDRGIDRSHPPFLDRDFEYPPLIGEVMYAATLPVDHGFRWPFLTDSVFSYSSPASSWRWKCRTSSRWAWRPSRPLPRMPVPTRPGSVWASEIKANLNDPSD
jgi:hypothetical protein